MKLTACKQVIKGKHSDKQKYLGNTNSVTEHLSQIGVLLHRYVKFLDTAFESNLYLTFWWYNVSTTLSNNKELKKNAQTLTDFQPTPVACLPFTR